MKAQRAGRGRRGGTRPRRGAFTLVEILVFGTIALLLLATTWNLFADSFRRGGQTARKMEAVQSALLLSVLFERDLESMYEPTSYGQEEQKPAFGVSPTDTRIVFRRFGPRPAEESWEPLDLQRVIYTWDQATGLVLRQVGGQEPRAMLGRYESFHFRFSDPGQDEAPSLVYSISAIPSSAVEKEEGDRAIADRSVVVGAVSRYQTADRSAYPFWNPVPYGPTAEP